MICDACTMPMVPFKKGYPRPPGKMFAKPGDSGMCTVCHNKYARSDKHPGLTNEAKREAAEQRMKQVSEFLQRGLTVAETANVLGVSRDTLDKSIERARRRGTVINSQRKCKNGLHEMIPSNTFLERHERNGRIIMSHRCLACRRASHEYKPVEDNVLATPRIGWQDKAGCRGSDQDFTPDTRLTNRDLNELKSYCEVCPVRTMCLVDAIVNHDSGVRGGYWLPAESDKAMGYLRSVDS